MKTPNDDAKVSLDSGCDSLINLIESLEWDEQFRAYMGWDE